jgi:hypothetical protein
MNVSSNVEIAVTTPAELSRIRSETTRRRAGCFTMDSASPVVKPVPEKAENA